jgi:hypothetical protein
MIRNTDISNKTFGLLTALRFVCFLNKRPMWKCQCKCGQITLVCRYDLTREDQRQTRSCGCLKTEKWIAARTKHGCAKTETPTYQSWKNMRARCNHKNRHDYKHYGGRGIQVCKEWDSFNQFLQDMGEKPVGFSLERKNVNDGYCKQNCEWIPKNLQPSNTRKSVRIPFQESLMSANAISKIVNIHPDNIRRWHKSGLNIEQKIKNYKKRGNI